jgi:hypothetical protein
MALRQWIFTRIEVVRARPKNDIGKKLGEMLDYEKAHKPVKLARSRVAAKAAAMLFKELVASIDANPPQLET